jgi:predicted metal-binding membrane protein
MTAMWLRMTLMWTAMMVPMMLPSLVPRLRARPLPAAIVAALCYFLVWTAVGAAIYPPTMGFPIARYAGAAFVVAGVVQLTPWKLRWLARCRAFQCVIPSVSEGPGGAGGAPHTRPGPSLTLGMTWGLRMGLDCALCCTGYTLVLLVTGMMNWTAMILVTAAITAERLLPCPALLARAFGVILIVAAAFVTGSPPRM